MALDPITGLPVATALDGTEIVPLVQGGTTKRATVLQIANTATGFAAATALVQAGVGLAGGGAIASNPTLSLDISELTIITSMGIADSFAVNSVSSGNLSRQVTFPNAMKAITGLTALGSPDLSLDYLPIVHAADGLTYKINPGSLALASGNMPAGGTTGQILIKASNTNYDTIWSTGAFSDQIANVVFAGPSSGGSAQPAFRALVGADLPNPSSTVKGGVKSYGAVSNQFITSISTSGTPASAQPAFTDISGTATVSQGGTGKTTLTAHGVLLGEGTSAIAITAAMTDGQLLVGQTGADPLPKSITGDVTITAAGVTAIGANTVLNTMLRQGVARSVIGVTGNATANVADIQGTASQVLVVNDAGTALAFGPLNLATAAAVTGTLPSSQGGTDNASYAIGDILYASGATTLTRLPDVATGNALISGGITTAPSWGKIALATHVSGTLPIANGGTGQITASAAFDALSPVTTRGDIIYRNATTNARLAIGAANTVLRTNGTDPAWGSVVLTTDVTGTLPVANGGTGVTSFNQNGVLIGNLTSAVQVSGPGITGQVLAGNTLALPTFQGIASILDNISSTEGQILYRNATTWVALAVGTDGQVLTTHGAAADPTWTTVTGTGTVTSVSGSGGTTGLTLTGGAITSSGTLTLGGTLVAANGGTGQASYTQGDMLYASASTTISKLAKDTNASRYLSNTGGSNNPAWAQVDLTNGVTGTLPAANIPRAVQSDMETATSTTLLVQPGVQQFHPGHPKCWAYVKVAAGTPTLTTSYNITSITDSGVGVLTVTIATDFSDANWASINTTSNNNYGSELDSSKAAGSCVLRALDNTGTLVDPTSYNFVGLGDQA